MESLKQFLGETFQEVEPTSAEERILAGIREALEEAHARMKYAAREYERVVGARKEGQRAVKIRKSIMALLMERW